MINPSAGHDHDHGWIDDGHTIAVYIEHYHVDLRIVCPATGCKAKYGCEHCEGQGYVYPDGNEEPCPACDESGRNEQRATTGDCWLRDEIGYYDGTMTELCMNAEAVEVTGPMPIVWRDNGNYDDPQPEWKSRGVEGYHARITRDLGERAVEAYKQRIARMG